MWITLSSHLSIRTYAKDLLKSDIWDRIAFNYGGLGLLVGTAIACSVLGTAGPAFPWTQHGEVWQDELCN